MFVPDGDTLTFGEMEPDAKHAISHRARAFAALRPRLPRRRRSRLTTSRLRRLRPLAVLRLEVPLLRLQQPCARGRHRRGALPARVPDASCGTGPSWHRAAQRGQHLLRRRHAIADVGRTRSAPILDAIGAAVDRRRRRRDHAGGQSVERRGRPLPRLSRGRRQPRLARRAVARRRRPARARAACTRPRRRWPRSRSRAHTFERFSFDLIYARPGQTLAGLADGAGAGARRSPAGICRSTSSPSSRRRRSPRCTRAASSRVPDERAGARLSTS